MGQAIDLPLQWGAGHYIVSEGGDAYLTREVGTVKAGSGKIPAGIIMTKDTDGLYIPWVPASTNAVILYEGIDARTAAAKRTFTVRLAEVQRSALAFAGTPTDNQKNLAYSQLAANNVVLR